MTVVTLSVPIFWDSHWIHISEHMILFDCETEDIYKIRGADKTFPMGKLFWIEGFKNQNIAIDLYFPKLQSSVNKINLIEIPNNSYKDIPKNGLPWRFENIIVNDYFQKKKGRVFE